MKTFDPARDIVNQLSTVNEVITFGGSLFTSSAGEPNIKKFNHWISGSQSGSFYHAIYSTQYSASTAIELVDATYGQSISSSYYTHPSASNKEEKNRMYRLFAKQLLGDEDSRFSIGGVNRDNVIFLAIKRSQFKDEIKKGSTSITTAYSGSGLAMFNARVCNDADAASVYSQTSRGDTAELKSGSTSFGKLFYQAGVAVLVPELVSNTSSISTNVGNFWSGSQDYEAMAVSGGGGTYENMLDAVRYRVRNVSFVNQVNLHATYYFCRALNDEFNYSSNPTFVDTNGRIIPTSGANNLITKTYPTRVGLIGENGEILAVATMSKPVKKSPDNEVTIKVRLDY